MNASAAPLRPIYPSHFLGNGWCGRRSLENVGAGKEVNRGAERLRAPDSWVTLATVIEHREQLPQGELQILAGNRDPESGAHTDSSIIGVTHPDIPNRRLVGDQQVLFVIRDVSE
jgi:hypothetical protein